VTRAIYVDDDDHDHAVTVATLQGVPLRDVFKAAIRAIPTHELHVPIPPDTYQTLLEKADALGVMPGVYVQRALIAYMRGRA
jgi:hypothetical protein